MKTTGRYSEHEELERSPEKPFLEDIYKDLERIDKHFNTKTAADIKKKMCAAINYTHSCKSDSEQLHTEVFNLANKLAINGYGNEAVKMHIICNGM